MTDDQHVERGIRPHHIVVGVCVLVLVVFALLNTDDVRVHFLVRTVRAPLILVIVVCALLGFVIGWFIGRRRNDN